MTGTKKQTATQRILKSMLTENTGVALCDSGGTPRYDADGKYLGSDHGYGRAYERNQGVDFDSLPPVELRVNKWDIEYTRQIYHWLLNHVEFDRNLQRRFDRFAARPGEVDNYWWDTIHGFIDYLRERGEHVTGLYGEDNPISEYTYNQENSFSQDFQFVFFNLGEKHLEIPYAIIMLHNGCDARGGFTAPKCFNLSPCSDDADFLSWGDAYISCAGDPKYDPNQLLLHGGREQQVYHQWQTDDCHHWYRDGECGYKAKAQLQVYDRAELPEDKTPADIPGLLLDNPGILYYDDAHNGYCPECGARLEIM